jgi:nucleoside-diphosphate-sugar epimerase
MKKAIVTGATGFIGKYLMESLCRHGIDVTAIVLPSDENQATLPIGVKMIELDICDILSLPTKIVKQPDSVFYHLAWNGVGGPKRADYTIQTTNVKTSLDAYTVADTLGCKTFITVGTVGEYMAQSAIERNIVSENFVYAASKNYLKQILRIEQSKYKCKAVYATLSGSYGPLDSTMNVINYTVNTLKSGDRATFGKAEQLFDFVYITDVVWALRKLGEFDNPEFHYNVSSGDPKRLCIYLRQIAEKMNALDQLGIGERPDDGTFYFPEWFDCSNLIRDISYAPPLSFEERIRELLRGLQI